MDTKKFELSQYHNIKGLPLAINIDFNHLPSTFKDFTKTIMLDIHIGTSDGIERSSLDLIIKMYNRDISHHNDVHIHISCNNGKDAPLAGKPIERIK